ncbi:hypothetical protein Dimus_020455 [Dionaea muscipula]
MPRVQLAHVLTDDFDDFRFPSPFHEQHQWPRFVNRGIVSGRSVDLEPLHHKYLNDMLVGYGSGGLMDLPEVVYPNLVRMFYTNVELQGRGERTVLKFYLTGKWYTLNRSMLASIFDITLENILPKAGHLDAVTPFECYILYCFETEVYLDLPYIIMKEIIRIREAADDSKALGFGAMLTKIFEVFDVDLEGEEIILTKGPINSISVTSSKISEKIAARAHDRGNPRVIIPVAPPAPADPAPAPVPQSVTGCLQTLASRYTELRTDSVRRTDHLARLEATQSSQANSIRDMEIEQIRLRNVIGEVRSDITRSEERIRTSIDDLTQMFRRRFPSPPADP